MSLLNLMSKVVQVLQGDSDLTALVLPDSIGVNIRKSPDSLAIEVGLDGGNDDRDSKELQRLRVTVYGTSSAADVLQIADMIESLLTPRNLTDREVPLYVAQVRKTRNLILPADDFGHQIELAFDVRLANP